MRLVDAEAGALVDAHRGAVVAVHVERHAGVAAGAGDGEGFFAGALRDGDFAVNSAILLNPTLIDGARAGDVAALRDVQIDPPGKPYTFEQYYALLVTLVAERDRLKQRDCIQQLELLVEADERLVPGTAQITQLQPGQYLVTATTLKFGDIEVDL